MSNIQTNVTEGSAILLSDYNNIQTKIATIMGAGSSQSGYGQAVSSYQLGANSVIDDAHWDNLRTDLLKARQHQTGVDESANLTDVTVGELVDDAVITRYETFATTVENNKFAIAANQKEQSGTTSSSLGAWNGTRAALIYFTFASADAARYFFNAGGILSFSGTAGVNGGGSKDQTWWNMTSGVVGTVGAGGSISFYGLTDQFQRVASIGAAAGVYVENRYFIDVRCNLANNSSGGADQVIALLTFQDNDLGDRTGTGPAVDENVSQASVSAFSVRSIYNVVVTAPTIGAAFN